MNDYARIQNSLYFAQSLTLPSMKTVLYVLIPLVLGTKTGSSGQPDGECPLHSLPQIFCLRPLDRTLVSTTSSQSKWSTETLCPLKLLIRSGIVYQGERAIDSNQTAGLGRAGELP